MGICSSGLTPEEQYEKSINKAVESRLKDSYAEMQRVMNVLILGTGEAGKSTILKQLKLLHTVGGFSEDERKEFRDLLRYNVYECAYSVARFCWEQKIDHEPQNMEHAELLMRQRVQLYTAPPPEIGDALKALVTDAGMQRALERRTEFDLLDSVDFLFENVHRLYAPDFEPTDDDILRSRRPTRGVVETRFVIDKMVFKVYDVGGQRGERKKWIHCFDSVRAIMFVASLSEFDQRLREDRRRWRIRESMKVFKGICALPWFTETPVMLFLNKDDLFREKIHHTNPQMVFHEYDGGCDYDNALVFIRDKYLALLGDKHPATVYVHVTFALDKAQVAFVWEATKRIILHERLEALGLE